RVHASWPASTVTAGDSASWGNPARSASPNSVASSAASSAASVTATWMVFAGGWQTPHVKPLPARCHAVAPQDGHVLVGAEVPYGWLARAEVGPQPPSGGQTAG